MATRVTLPADVHQVDATGFVWTYLDGADDPSQVVVGSVIVAGDADEPFFAVVVDVVEGPSGRSIVHLDVDAAADEWTAELERRARAVGSGIVTGERWEHVKAAILERLAGG